MSILDHVVRLARAEGVLEGFDAAVRADVAYAAEHFERRAVVWREHAQKAKGDLSRGCMAKAWAFAEKAKDCRRWLEATS